jgi:hypothetical protein
MDGGRWIETEFGPVWKPHTGKRRGPTPHAKLKAAARVALSNWKHRTGIKAKLLPYFVGKVKTHDGARSYQVGKTGTGDDLIGLLGTCVMVEYKAGEDRQSPDQRDMQRDWEETGNPYVLVRKPADLTDFLDLLAAEKGYIF